MNAPLRTSLTIARPLLICPHPETNATLITVRRTHRVCVECGAWRIEVQGAPPPEWTRPRLLAKVSRELHEYDQAIAAAVEHVRHCGAL
jgi:hypothetical protein